MIWRWLPWKFLIGRAARAYGMIDPIQVLARLRGFSQPSEVQEPIELLRAGVVFQARGLINARVIQYNMDWIWPYWVTRQFGPNDPAFVPRAFSFGHINLTQRSWTAVGHPDVPLYPIVDPRGLVTPLYDGWSLDCWLIDDHGNTMIPSREPYADQQVRWEPRMTLRTSVENEFGKLVSEATIRGSAGKPLLTMIAHGRLTDGGWLVISVRPCNPEGISFVEKIDYDQQHSAWRINKKDHVVMEPTPDRVGSSDFRHGDIFHRIIDGPVAQTNSVHCSHGLANAAAAFRLEKGQKRIVTLHIPLRLPPEVRTKNSAVRTHRQRSHSVNCQLVVPDGQYQFLFDNAAHTLKLLSADDIYPGPYTYRRFWFRDGCLMLHALLCIGELERARGLLQLFLSRQKRNGYFQSQEGEWDSNGQVLWVLYRYRQLSGAPLPSAWASPIVKAARWILAKRTPRNGDAPHAGLLPAGFSAEHLGPNDHYYWDNFWSISGLDGAARLLGEMVSKDLGKDLGDAARRFEKRVFETIEAIPYEQALDAIPAAPYRRMDAGAIGSMVADYPLQLTRVGNQRLLATLEHLLSHHMVKNGFYQDMIHSGINAYLTLALAQTLLRHGDGRYADLLQAVADLASPTGNWPEAVHPFSGGGCMGDGQHGWAAAEWVMMIRSLFVREEENRLVIGSGLLNRWLEEAGDGDLRFGPTPTAHGPVTVKVSRPESENDVLTVHVACDWHHRPTPVDIRIPGYVPRSDVDLSEPIRVTPLNI